MNVKCFDGLRYRLTVDDGIYFLRDLVDRRCTSLFDSPFLAMLRELHEVHGTRTSVNLFFETPDADFNLTHVPDTYRTEWADNADWLRLAFHARAEFPDRPYANVGSEELLRDYDDVGTEVLRFAGESCWSPMTVLHWCVCPADVLPSLLSRGVRVLSGLFRKKGEGGWDLGYSLDDALCAAVSRDGLATDANLGITFSRVDVVLNRTPVPRIGPALEQAVKTTVPRVIDLLTHEQYSWPFYAGYLPDHAERLHTAARWCTARGYRSVFMHEEGSRRRDR